MGLSANLIVFNPSSTREDYIKIQVPHKDFTLINTSSSTLVT